jgi:hypothetical protein
LQAALQLHLDTGLASVFLIWKLVLPLFDSWRFTISMIAFSMLKLGNSVFDWIVLPDWAFGIHVWSATAAHPRGAVWIGCWRTDEKFRLSDISGARPLFPHIVDGRVFVVAVSVSVSCFGACPRRNAPGTILIGSFSDGKRSWAFPWR